MQTHFCEGIIVCFVLSATQEENYTFSVKVGLLCLLYCRYIHLCLWKDETSCFLHLEMRQWDLQFYLVPAQFCTTDLGWAESIFLPKYNALLFHSTALWNVRGKKHSSSLSSRQYWVSQTSHSPAGSFTSYCTGRHWRSRRRLVYVVAWVFCSVNFLKPWYTVFLSANLQITSLCSINSKSDTH